jgi:polyisoprenoid-binding protein YceI
MSTDIDELTGDYTIDPIHSSIGFTARHAMVTKVRGTFDEFDGHLHLDATDPSKSTAKVTIKAASIDTRNADRDAHLRSNDFFAMDEYPEITFESTSVEPVDDATFRVTGDLTIRGVTRPVTFDLEYNGSATDPFGNKRVGLEGSVQVNRKDWGITWNAPLELGGVIVSDKVTLEFDISAIKNT